MNSPQRIVAAVAGGLIIFVLISGPKITEFSGPMSWKEDAPRPALKKAVYPDLNADRTPCVRILLIAGILMFLLRERKKS